MSITLLVSAFLGGLLSVASPCVLPILPILFAGSHLKSKWRPIFVVLGLSLIFIIMGIITSIAASAIMPYMRTVEIILGIFLVIVGILMAFDINIFKKIKWFSNIQVKDNGSLLSAFLIGASLGIVWIPCVGPVLSSILAMVATNGTILGGITLLAVYSIGFSIPMLLVAYSAQIFVQKFKFFSKNPIIVRIITSMLLIILGLLLSTMGMYSIVSFIS